MGSAAPPAARWSAACAAAEADEEEEEEEEEKTVGVAEKDLVCRRLPTREEMCCKCEGFTRLAEPLPTGAV